ncbi:MAG TPA: NADH-quinone oxidoreductase subunit J [Sedimenticola thiotaurini]|uniref:NADH-quinone oxidoreductase subunit J n=1 Tax=Sedimenticola thiotaurini TaxID=1543721 RepID=A0A831RPF8_9GAMM|nr:NADH-quinone oxidoreductase subunit J [Sedimenticola thiotaurini]
MSQIALTIALPFLAAFLLPVIGRVYEALARVLGPLVLLYCLWLVLQLWGTGDGHPVALAMGGFRPPMGITLYVDRLALLFTLLVSLMTLLLWPWQRAADSRECALTLLLAGSASGLALSGDLFNIYVFYELVSVASFGLVAVHRSGAAFVATLRYLVISGFGTVLALTGIALVYSQTGTLNLAQLAQLAPDLLAGPVGLAGFLFMLLGFGVKGELFPVNTWVPEVYATAPARASALLAGLVSKLSLLVVLRLLVLLYQQEQALQLLLLLGVLGVISGELAAWRARDLKRMLAFSSIGQLGAMFIAFSIPGNAGLLAGLALALHHLLVKPALFLLAAGWPGAVERLRGLARGGPLAAGLFVLLALSLIGVPPLPGFWAKMLLVVGLAGQESGYLLALAVVLGAAVLEASYLFRVVAQLYHRDEEAARPRPYLLDLGSAALAGAVLLSAVPFISPLGDWLAGTAAQAGDREGYIITVFPAAGRPLYSAAGGGKPALAAAGPLPEPKP